MKFLKSHFALSRSQQNGIFILVLIIVILQIAYFTVDFYPDDSPKLEDREIEVLRNKLDSIAEQQALKNPDTIYPFNPNFLTDYRGYILGLTPEEIDRLLEYRKGQQWINSAEDFQRVTGISDSLLLKISPYFRFPEWTERSTIKTKVTSVKKNIEKRDLNSAKAEDLRQISGIGKVLSVRIVKYRNSIGGFLDEIQLYDVYGLSDEVIESLKEQYIILTKPTSKKVNINNATVLELAEIPYFNYTMAAKIVDYRQLHEKIYSFEELSKIDGFPGDKIDRIKLYLALN